ncbi:family 20 glycosylhydrolase [Thalassotalea euphylliae]|uniref:family 20 glycosylhydrolase n=1 Tax=Thalassotalea euphylliae TaxID=1655234 RepID=UPI003631B6B7
MKLSTVALTLFSLSVLSACSDNSQNESMQNKTELSDQVAPANVPETLQSAGQADIDLLAAVLDVKYRLVTNEPSVKCDKDKANGACFEVELSFTAKQDIKVKDWSIYFSQISPVQSFESDWAQVSHLNGDLHKISLSEGFTGFMAGETKTLLFRANFWSLSETDALPNYIVTGDNLTARVIASTKPMINPETGLEVLPYVEPYTDEVKHFKRDANDKTVWLTAERLYERNAAVNEHAQDISSHIIPTPKQLVETTGKPADISAGLSINWENVSQEEVAPALERLTSLGINFNNNGLPITFSKKRDGSKKPGSYLLSVTATEISIVGVDGNGVFNGLQSLAALLTPGSALLPAVTVEDEPHYEFRGILVDVARNFHDKAFILKLLDQMAAYKMNKLHLHLGDDEGWRLEIPSLPELTEIASKRCFDPEETTCLLPQLGAGVDPESGVNGYYSVADYQEILVAAKQRYIQVIPSLDMPGHSRAAVTAMNARYKKYMALEQEDKATEFLLHDQDDKTVYSSVQYYNDNTINVCMESSYKFIEQVMKDVKAIHAEVGHPLTRYHIGADETAGAWVDSPACQSFLAEHKAEIASSKELGAYFVERVSNMLAELDIEAAAWIDGLEHTNPENMPPVVQVNAWHPLAWQGHQSAHKLANYNWQVVVSSPDVTYFDFPYEADPKEHGYYWAARQINTRKMFNFMPDNLPVHAEFWLDRADNQYEADDTLQLDEQGKVKHAPLNKGLTFLGLQGQLWSENARTENTAEYKLFPRFIALAERAWHQADWAVPYNYDGFKYSKETNAFTAELRAQRDQAWFNFAHTLGTKELAKLDIGGVHFRIPTVGAKVIDGQLHANTAFPGLAIEYREQGKPWLRYEQPVAVDGEVEVRSVNYLGDRFGRELKVK